MFDAYTEGSIEGLSVEIVVKRTVSTFTVESSTLVDRFQITWEKTDALESPGSIVVK
jgi:hypothetical protein